MAPLSPTRHESVRLTLVTLLALLLGQGPSSLAEEAPPAAEKTDAAPADADEAGEQSLEFVVGEIEHRRETKYLLRGSLRNSGDTDVRGAVHVVLLGASSPGFELLRPDGNTKDDEPFVEFVRTGRVLKAGAKSATRAIQFELEAELPQEELETLEFEFRIEGPEVRESKRRSTGGGRDRDGRDRDPDEDEDDRDRDEAARNPDGDDADRPSEEGDRPDDPDRPDHDSDSPGPDVDGGGRPDGDDADEEEPLDPSLFFGHSKGVKQGQPVSTAFVKLHSVADRLPKQIAGRPVAPQVTWPFESFGHAGKGGGPVAGGQSHLGRTVLSRPLDGTPPAKGVVVGFDFQGHVQVGRRPQPVSGLLVVTGVAGPFARQNQAGTQVLDDQGRPIGTVVGGNGTYTLVGGPPPPKKKRILFVGNSYTFGNNLPNLVAAVAKAGGRELEVASSTEGGATLRRHVDRGEAVKTMRASKFDYVVLQDQSLNPLFNRAHMWAAATELHAEIGRTGAKTLFFMTWARQGKPEMTKGLAEAYQGIAGKLGAGVAPVGLAWHAVNHNTGLGLYTDDGSHPNLKGSLLAAFVFYARITGDDPRKVPGSFGINPAEAAVLKTVAAQTVGAGGQNAPAN